MKNKKSIILLAILAIVFVSIAVGVTYAFFNYTRTGSENTIRTGRIYFHTDQDSTINLTNVFPVASNSVVSNSSNTVTVDIEGDTTYTGGIEYLVTIVGVTNSNVPVNFKASVNNLGTSSNTYWDSRGGNAPIYALREEGIASGDEQVMVGYIPAGSEGVDGSISITAYVDIDNVAISDTYSRIVNNNLVIGETTSEWALGRTVVTTDEWNNLTSSNPLSFKIKVEANEGIWVEEPKINILKNLSGVSNWSSIKNNVTSIEFSTNPEVPANAITSFDATDVGSYGPVTVYTLDDGLGNNTVKAVICADGEIYAPTDSTMLFALMSNLETIDSTNFKVDNVTNMTAMLGLNTKMTDIGSLSNWNTSNVTTMLQLFYGCSSLTNVDALLNWNTSSLIIMADLFNRCANLLNVNGLINWNTSNVTVLMQMFYNCSSLSDINGLTNWNTANVITMRNLFFGCSNLINFAPLARWNTSNVEDMYFLFGMAADTSKTGYSIVDFSALSNWNTGSVRNMEGMFQNINISSYLPFKNWNVSNVEDFSSMFNQTYLSTTTTLNGLENWDVSSATDMSGMFRDNASLTDASAINNWNINSNINFSSMFYNTPVHPEFTRVAGTWDSNGTFTPA